MEKNKLPLANSHQVTPQLTVADRLSANDCHPEGYNHNNIIGIGNPDWMSKLPDGIRISQISMVGTHDTMAFYGGDILACQTLPLETQLNAGIRALDIRCKDEGDVLAIYHNIQFEGVYLNDVLNTVVNFLHIHPGETVLMRMCNENGSEARIFNNVFYEGYWKSYKQYFWEYKKDYDNPTLGEVRGKIVLLQNFETPNTHYSIPWNSQIFEIQDAYRLNTNWDLYSKWEKVKSHLIEANGNTSKIYINFLSGSCGSFPYFVASGQSTPQNGAPRLLTGKTTPGWQDDWPDFPRVGCFIGICSIVFEGTNNLIINYLREHPEIKHSGIIMCDFPGPELINTIIELNELSK